MAAIELEERRRDRLISDRVVRRGFSLYFPVVIELRLYSTTAMNTMP